MHHVALHDVTCHAQPSLSVPRGYPLDIRATWMIKKPLQDQKAGHKASCFKWKMGHLKHFKATRLALVECKLECADQFTILFK